MSTAGQYNYKGINAQAWAAMSLFLQYLRDPAFTTIQLEGEYFEDFALIFSNGKKIICESKDRKKSFSYPQLKELLEKIASKGSCGEKDEILVICSRVNQELTSEISHIGYFDDLQKKFTKKGYTALHLSLLPKVKFWVVPSSFNEEVIYALFSELISFWIPSTEIRKSVDSILIQKIYKGSARGATYSRADLLEDINNLADEIRQNTIYRKDLVKREKQFKELEKALNKPGHLIWRVSKELSAFSTDFERLVFAKDRLEKKQSALNLANWDPVWQLNKVRYFTFGIFHIFENNLHTDKNRIYVLDYIKKYSRTIRGFYQTDFFDIDVVKIVTKIIDGEHGKKYLRKAFGVISDLITFKEDEFFYLKSGSRDHDEWERGEICKLLHKVYSLADDKLKQDIFKLLISAFNITEDDGDFDWHAPREVYAIIHDWLDEDFLGRFGALVKIISEQYSKYYKKFGNKVRFLGWEHMGGGTSYGPGGYHVGDRHFIGGILAPSIRSYYMQDKDSGWKFIKKYCISKTSKITSIRPDFLNRAVYDVVFDRYLENNDKVSEEAFIILSEFIMSRKGIPHKSDLIYQRLSHSNAPDDKKWKLIELTVKKYPTPVNPFAEQIIADLAKKGHNESRKILKGWLNNPEYYKRAMFDAESVTSIRASLDTDFDYAVDLFKTLILSDYIKTNKSNHFSAYNVAVLLQDILKKDYNKGLSIIRLLEAEKSLSDDQQIVYAFGLFGHQGNDDSDSREMLLKIYSDVIDPFLNTRQNDITKICQRITHAHSRDAFVQFATRLAVKKNIAESLRIVKVFIDDPDPYLPGKDPEDLEDKYNEHKQIQEGKEPHSINSVRGWCGWTLMKCSVLAGREFIPDIIRLTEHLVKDKNYYVVHMGTFALHQLAVNRLTVLPDNREVLFFNDDKKTALETARQVEDIAFNLLERFSSWPAKVQDSLAKSILHVFDPIRAINKKRILRFLDILSKLPNEAIDEAAPLFLFYAELRADAYKDWKFSLPGLYDDLVVSKKEAKEFRAIMLGVIKRLQVENPDKCFRFLSAAEHLMRDGSRNEIEKQQYTEIALEYFNLLTNNYGHNIFNLAYRTIEDKLRADDKYKDKWYELLVKCFGVEKVFYQQQVSAGNQREVYWYPSLYHTQILELVLEKLGKEKFISVAKVFFLEFPKEINLHESDALVASIKELAKSDHDAKKIIDALVERNPSKYWGLSKNPSK